MDTVDPLLSGGAFEQLMAQGVLSHNQGEYEQALALSERAYGIADAGSSEQGRAARDNSARCDRLDRDDEATAWAEEAYTIHDTLVMSAAEPEQAAYRERSASSIYLSVMGTRRVIRAQLAGQNPSGITAPLTLARQSWNDIQTTKSMAPEAIDRQVDQYEINAVRRVSIVESLLGNRKQGLRLAVRGIRLSPLSESPKLATTNHELNPQQRREAKIKALKGGIGALGVAVMASRTAGRRQTTALRWADRVL